MPDRIFVENLRLSCRIGLTEEERAHAQDVLVDVSLFLGLARPGKSDDLKDSLDYREVTRRIGEFAMGREFNLLESFAEGVAAVSLDAFPVERVTVRARKAKYSGEPSIGVELERSRGTWSSPR